ncbi:glycerophosphodiester phosphodiesterase family protein [Peribacillus sp. SCS-37]|uniref:glycerophosphodiester phosphodiesterase family protein n=1 Tax=Paraperibacillus esterisolvens TaxID=3115296 RepID=UPI00390606B7
MSNKRKLSGAMLAATLTFSSLPLIPGNVNHVLASPLVLVDQNFDTTANDTLPAGWKLLQGKASVKDGKLVLASPSTSQPARVIVPLSADSGDYVFEADMTFTAAAENTRWASMMYRIQNNNYPYYQAAIRKGTSALNGLEFALRNDKNQWVVPETNFYHEDFQLNKSYRIKIVASKNRVQQFINGKLVIDTDQAGLFTTGNVGFQAQGTTVQFDNVRVTGNPGELPPVAHTGAFLPAEHETNIVNAPTLIAGSNAEQAQNVSSAILEVKSLNGEAMVDDSTLTDKLASMKGKTIPVIQLEQKGLEEKVVDALNESQTTDVHIVSTNPEIVKEVTNIYPTARGGILYTRNDLNKHDLAQLAKDIHANHGKLAIIPQKVLSPEVVYYLHTRGISVWGKGAENADSAHGLIHLGVDGIVSDTPQVTGAALGEYPENTLIQRPIVAAHRGVPSKAPENTMTSYRLAYNLGADMIETDVQKTKDGHLVIMHDDTVNRTTDGTGKVEDLTLEEIRALDAGIKFSPEFRGEKVPLFKEFLDEFKGKPVVLLIELKKAGYEDQVLTEIEEAGMTDQVVLQSFALDSMQNVNKLNPELPIGYLYSSAVPKTESDKLKQAKKMLDYGTNSHVTLNASYGSLYQEFITYMRQRGLLSMHWTFRAEAPLADQLKKGVIGPITDYTQWLSESPVRLETPLKKMNLKVGKTADLNAKAKLTFRSDETKNIETQLFVPNGDVVSVEGNTIKAAAPGRAQVFVKHTFTMLGEEWNLVSEPIEVNVSE